MKKYNPYDWMPVEIKPIQALKVDKSKISPRDHYKAAKKIALATDEPPREKRKMPDALAKIRKMI